MNKQRKDLSIIFQSALDAVNGTTVVNKQFKQNHYPNNLHIIAIGKAADAMLQGVPLNHIKSALLISKQGYISEKSKNNALIQWFESDHPIPKQASLDAGQALIEYLQKIPAQEPCLFLISGGASALVEVLNDGWNLSKLQELTDYLLANAYSIDEINAVRRSISKIKGGGLWDYMGQRSVFCLMISDVPDDDPKVIGSGLLFSSASDKFPYLPLKFANNIKRTAKIFKNVKSNSFSWEIIASLSDAKKAAAYKAKQLGYQVKVVDTFLEGKAEDAAKMCVKTLSKEEGTLFIWGGETTVKLPKNAGKGGRNQHLALTVAIEIQGMENTCLLAAGTDGSDGVTLATGVIVDNQTVKKGEKYKLNAIDYLKCADSNTYFQKTEDLIVTGATGTNVMDLVLGISFKK